MTTRFQLNIATRAACILAAMIVFLRPAVCMAQAQGTAQPAPEAAQQDVVAELPDGTCVAGKLPADATLPVQTSEMKATVTIKLIDTITMSDDHKTALVTMQNGDRIRGAIDAKPLPLTTADGRVLKLDLNSARTLTVFPPGGPAAEGLVFWNTLANEKEALKSLVGPDPTPYKPHRDAGVAAGRGFPGDGPASAMTITGSYASEVSARNLMLGDLGKVINPEEGCIELWYCQAARPVGYKYGVYRMFDGDYGLESCAQVYAVPYGLVFEMKCGEKQQQEITVRSAAVPSRQWLHVAAVWNRKGINGSHDTMRVYIDGKLMVAGASGDWGSTAAGEADIGGGNDDCAGKYLIGNLKIWNREKTNFEDGKPPMVDPKKLPPVKEEPPEDDPDDDGG